MPAAPQVANCLYLHTFCYLPCAAAPCLPPATFPPGHLFMWVAGRGWLRLCHSVCSTGNGDIR